MSPFAYLNLWGYPRLVLVTSTHWLRKNIYLLIGHSLLIKTPTWAYPTNHLRGLKLTTFYLAANSVIYWQNWLWVLGRRINGLSQVRRLGDDLIVLQEPSVLLRDFQEQRLFVISNQMSEQLEALGIERIRLLVAALARKHPIKPK